MAFAPQSAKLSGTVTWSDGTNFNGFVAIGVAVPNDGAGTAYPTISLTDEYPSVRLPLWFIIPIVDGVFDQSSSVYFNTAIEPPGCRFAAYFYDVNRIRIAPSGTASLFDITTDPHPLTVPTLTRPTTSVTAPTPQS